MKMRVFWLWIFFWGWLWRRGRCWWRLGWRGFGWWLCGWGWCGLGRRGIWCGIGGGGIRLLLLGWRLDCCRRLFGLCGGGCGLWGCGVWWVVGWWCCLCWRGGRWWGIGLGGGGRWGGFDIFWVGLVFVFWEGGWKEDILGEYFGGLEEGKVGGGMGVIGVRVRGEVEVEEDKWVRYRFGDCRFFLVEGWDFD